MNRQLNKIAKNNAKKIINQIESRRKKYNVSITNLAKRCDISRQSYYNIRDYKHIPSVELVFKLAEVTHLNLFKNNL